MKGLVICIIGLLAHASYSNEEAIQCEKERIKKCARMYKEAVENDLDHCKRLQIMIDCLAEDPSCDKITITSFRFWMLKMGLMDKIIQKCPNLKIDALKTLTTRSTAEHSDLYPDFNNTDVPAECAKDIHNECVKGYLDTLKESRNLCLALDFLNNCYGRLIEERDCKAKIIKYFAYIVQKVAPRVIKVLKNNLSRVCQEWPQDN